MKRNVSWLAMVLCAAINCGAAVLPAEKLLPDDTLALFTVPSFARAREIYSSAQGQLWRDPAIRAFKDKFMDKLTAEFVTPLERDLGVHFTDYTNLPQGQVTVAVTQNGWTGDGTGEQAPAVLFLVDTKDKSAQLTTNLNDLKKKWVDAGKKIRTEKIRDVEFSVITPSTNDIPKTLLKKAAGEKSADQPEAAADSEAKKPAAKPEIYIGQAESLLIAGNSPKVIEKILARMSGADVKTLGDAPAYAVNHAALFRDAAAFGWVNTKVFVDLLSRMADSSFGGGDAGGSGNPFGFKPSALIAALGLNGLKTMAVSYRYSDEGAQGTFFLGVPEASRAGLFKILEGEPKECTPPPFVPADAMKFQRFRIDGQKSWAAIQKIVSDVSPQALNTLNFLLSTAEAAAKEKNPDFDIKKNLFGNLGDDIIIYSKAPKATGLAALNSGPQLFLIGSANAEQLAGGLRSILVLAGQQAGAPTEREFLGDKIYSLALPSMPVGTNDQPQSLLYAYSSSYLVLSTDSGIMEEYFRSSQGDMKSLKDTPGLADATQKVAGSGTSIFGYSNDSEAMRVTLEAVKKDFGSALSDSSIAPLLAAAGMTSDDKLKEWFDVSLLPGFDKISKDFSFTVFAETATPDGLVFKSFMPTPAQLKK